MYTESSGKIACRNAVYSEMAKSKKFVNGKHLVLAGPHCGDIRELTENFKIDPANITAIDRHAEYAIRATKYGAKGYAGDVNLFIDANKNQYISVNLDWCGQMTQDNLRQTCASGHAGLIVGGHLAVTFVCGRECGAILDVLNRIAGDKIERRLSLMHSLFYNVIGRGGNRLLPVRSLSYINDNGLRLIVGVYKFTHHTARYFPEVEET